MNGCEEIGTRVKELREALNLTQADLAQRLNVSRESVNLWERGARDMKTGTIIALSKALHTTCDYLLTGIETDNVLTHDLLGLNNDSINALIEIVARKKTLNGIDKQIASDQIEAINKFISNKNGRIVGRLIYNYLESDFSTVYIAPQIDCSVPHSGDVIQVEQDTRYYTCYRSTKEPSCFIPLDNGVFENSYLMRISDMIKSWKYEGGYHAQENNP